MSATISGTTTLEAGTCKAFRHVETLFAQYRNLVPSRPGIGWRGLFTFRQLIGGLQGTGLHLGRIKFLHVEMPYVWQSYNQRESIHFITYNYK